MRPRLLLAASAVVTVGTAAFVLARSQTGAPVKPDVPSSCSCCTDAECLAPSTCGDVDVVCPAGPDCFLPDICPDHDLICPADAAPAGS